MYYYCRVANYEIIYFGNQKDCKEIYFSLGTDRSLFKNAGTSSQYYLFFWPERRRLPHSPVLWFKREIEIYRKNQNVRFSWCSLRVSHPIKHEGRVIKEVSKQATHRTCVWISFISHWLEDVPERSVAQPWQIYSRSFPGLVNGHNLRQRHRHSI